MVTSTMMRSPLAVQPTSIEEVGASLRRYFAVAAASSAAATSASLLAAAPAAPIAPTTLLATRIGRPPATVVMPGSHCNHEVELP